MRKAHALLFLFFTACVPASDHQVPFGDKVNATVVNYNRTTPYLATSGELKEGAIDHLQALGFVSIVDLRTEEEGTAGERAKADKKRIRYINIPIGKEPPGQSEIDRFEAWIENPDNHPVLVHCASANRVGTLWAMYRLRQGIPLTEALAEGRTIGMKESRKDQVEKFAEQLPGR